MESTSISELSERARLLEDQVRELGARLEESRHRARRGFLALLCSTALVVVAGGAYAVDRIKRLEITGPRDDLRVAIGVNEANSSAGLEVYGTEGGRRLFVGVSPNGTPVIEFFNAEGRSLRAITP